MGIALDGGRYFTVVPQEDGISIERNFGWDISFAYYVRGTIRYILHEFYYDKSESSRYQYEDFINSILIFDSKDEKESFKLHVKEHWEEYKDTEDLRELYVEEMKGYDVSVFKKEYKNVQILQIMLNEFRRKRR